MRKSGRTPRPPELHRDHLQYLNQLLVRPTQQRTSMDGPEFARIAFNTALVILGIIGCRVLLWCVGSLFTGRKA